MTLGCVKLIAKANEERWQNNLREVTGEWELRKKMILLRADQGHLGYLEPWQKYPLEDGTTGKSNALSKSRGYGRAVAVVGSRWRD